jgi:hypothetical protein
MMPAFPNAQIIILLLLNRHYRLADFIASKFSRCGFKTRRAFASDDNLQQIQNVTGLSWQGANP